MRPLVVASGALIAATGGLWAQGRDRSSPQQKGGPPAVYRVEVPLSALNVIAGAPTQDSVTLSILGRNEPKATLAIEDATGRSIRSMEPALSAQPKEFAIRDLKPGTTYTYRLAQGDERVMGRFTTARLPKSPFTFVVQADSHLDGNSDLKVYERTLNNMIEDRPDFLVDLGDTFMVDKYKSYEDSRKQYEAQRYWFSRVGSQMSVFLAWVTMTAKWAGPREAVAA